jgi:regulator of protease activity HflC (stomatin/prohibitin superfamily)
MIPVVAIRKRKEAAAEAAETQKHAGAQHSANPDDQKGGARRFVNPVSALAFVVMIVLGLVVGIGMLDSSEIGLVAFFSFLFVGLVLFFGIKIAKQWEKAVVLRFGRFIGLKGPGIFFIFPILEEVSHLIDQRMRVTDVTAESGLTRDTVPVDVDAIVFWTVWDAQRSVLEVADYFGAVSLSAQTALREAIGRNMLAEMITERERLGHELQKILEDKTNAWGITVHSVEIRDVKLPKELEDAMSRQAQAERERQARIILGTAETEIASRFVKAGEEYKDKPVALHLRAMNMLYEAIKEKGTMVIVPSTAVETMGLGGMLGTMAIAPKVTEE